MDWIKSIKKVLCGFCREEVPLPKPILRKTISKERLWFLINQKFPTGMIYLSKAEYDLCDIEDIEALLDIDETNHTKWTGKHTCEASARRLYGQFAIPEWSSFAFGLFWSEVHAINICVDTNEDVWLIEPQNDERRSDLLDWQGTAMRVCII